MTRAHLRRAALGAVAALAVAAPAAQAGDGAGAVCNQASPHFQGGGLLPTDPPVDSPAARYTDDLSPLPGQGDGLIDAAVHSPSLTGCEGDGGGTPS